GFPLIGAGAPEMVKRLMAHNLERVKELRAEKVLFSCPSCYRTWKEHCETNVELVHASEFISGLIEDGGLHLKALDDMRVTYHDPCDLGRNSGIYDAPRKIIESIPGLTLVEMRNNREKSVCCGGGGNLEMADPALAGILAHDRLQEIQGDGAKTVLTACQQCLRTITTSARRQKAKLDVMDIIELVRLAIT
ncbi:unnamed protein product, partial [marine sediment metagenome]